MAAARFYVRNFELVAVTSRDAVTFVGKGGVPVTISPVDPQQFSRVLELLARPVPLRRIRQEVDEDTLRGLVAAGVVLEGGEAELTAAWRPPPVDRPCRHLVVGVTGAVNAVNVMSMLIQLHHRFCERLDVVFTESALHFVKPEALGYIGIDCWTDAFAPRGEIKVPHIHLARAAELVAVMPASAASLQRLASGACNDLLSLIVAATEAPVVVAPSMNRAMWAHPAVRRNVDQLRADGLHVIEPTLGVELADGPKAEPEHGGMGLADATVEDTLRAFLPKSRR